VPVFYTISTVREGFEKYKKTNSHHRCCEDLYGYFSDLSFTEIFAHSHLLQDFGHTRYIKMRIPCSTCGGKGKRGGYRAYLLADKRSESVVILAFYPKTGKFGKSDLSKEDEKHAFETYKVEKGRNELPVHDFASFI